MDSENISWEELTEVEVDENICWPSVGNNSELDPDWPFVDSEDYYQDQGKFLLPKTWNPPLKGEDIEPVMVEASRDWLTEQLEAKDLIFLIAKDAISPEIDDYRHDFLMINDVDKIKDATIYAFSRKYVLPVKAGQYSRQALAAFYNNELKKYQQQYIFAEIKSGIVNRNDSYKLNRAEEEYAKNRDSHAEYVNEMAHSETSTNCRIFGIDAKSAFLKSAKEIYDKY